MQNNIGQFVLVRSQRNPTALFGTGLIDSIPERVIEDAAKVKHPGFPEVAGRVSRLKDKRIGRFGWKAQTASLSDFVLTACAVELGLEVPDHHQGGDPQKPQAQAKGLDLSAEECNALMDLRPGTPQAPGEQAGQRRRIQGDRGRPASSRRSAARPATRPSWAPSKGSTATSCSTTWASSSATSASMASSIPARRRRRSTMRKGRSPDDRRFHIDAFSRTRRGCFAATKRPTTGPASRFEWRTPPLWGFRDSGPYLHDGRADTIDHAVALHGGEAQPSPESSSVSASGAPAGRGVPEVAYRTRAGFVRAGRQCSAVNRLRKSPRAEGGIRDHDVSAARTRRTSNLGSQPDSETRIALTCEIGGSPSEPRSHDRGRRRVTAIGTLTTLVADRWFVAAR